MSTSIRWIMMEKHPSLFKGFLSGGMCLIFGLAADTMAMK
jgi:hypothetical protein